MAVINRRRSNNTLPPFMSAELFNIRAIIIWRDCSLLLLILTGRDDIQSC